MHVLRGLRSLVLRVKTPPPIWMEARCGSVASITSPNWSIPEACHQTVRDGGYFSSIKPAKRHFQRQGWKVIDNTWWCPACATLMEN